MKSTWSSNAPVDVTCPRAATAAVGIIRVTCLEHVERHRWFLVHCVEQDGVGSVFLDDTPADHQQLVVVAGRDEIPPRNALLPLQRYREV